MPHIYGKLKQGPDSPIQVGRNSVCAWDPRSLEDAWQDATLMSRGRLLKEQVEQAVDEAARAKEKLSVVRMRRPEWRDAKICFTKQFNYCGSSLPPVTPRGVTSSCFRLGWATRSTRRTRSDHLCCCYLIISLRTYHIVYSTHTFKKTQRRGGRGSVEFTNPLLVRPKIAGCLTMPAIESASVPHHLERLEL